MLISQYGQQLVNDSTCCHTQVVAKNGKQFVAVINGLSYWARIEDGMGNLVEELIAETDPETGTPCQFSPYDFAAAGYELVKC